MSEIKFSLPDMLYFDTPCDYNHRSFRLSRDTLDTPEKIDNSQIIQKLSIAKSQKRQILCNKFGPRGPEPFKGPLRLSIYLMDT